MLQKSTFQFLRELKNNNHKAWFEANKTRYQNAKTDVEAFIGSVLSHLSKYDNAYAELKPAQCLFRIHRDVRFSKDKIPYKTNFGASLNPAGKKSLLAGLYIHIEPEASFVGGGLWMPAGPAVQAVRQEIDYQTDEFLELLSKPSFKRYYGDLTREHVLQRMPKGYEDGHAAANYLKLKSWVGISPVKDNDLYKSEAAAHMAERLWALNPLIQFINRCISDEL
ncbi:MAG: DUF2461 domain-containing protein [Chitinophagaceae bacterium]|nr:DUF2461 domain-containing protein [Chitinophagaceae bacterium]